ncbi:HTH_Tnp_Tc3_2 domain-containing protein [Trichonephila clavipes]|nr:HTH_Tnp_Tc3_2 domain-containing protein [Trichonephila clavipes]
MENHLSKLKVQNIYDLESETRGQASSERWRYERSLRLSSFFKEIACRKKSTPCSKLVMRIVYGRDLCNAAMKYGLANEEIARKQYEREYSTELCLVQNSDHTFDQVSELDRGRVLANRDCGLSFREIGSRVGRNQTTVMRICDRWMQEGTTNRLGRSHPSQCTISRKDRQIVRMAVTDRSVTSRTIAQHIESVTHHSLSARTIRRRLQ